MKKRFILSVSVLMAIGVSCSGCGLSGAGEIKSEEDVGSLQR